MTYLLDTCIVSELITKRPNPKVVTWIDSIDPDTAYLSVITLGEIQKGIAKPTDPLRQSRIEEWLHSEILIRFTGRILPLNLPILLEWGTLTRTLEQTGRKMAAGGHPVPAERVALAIFAKLMWPVVPLSTVVLS